MSIRKFFLTALKFLISLALLYWAAQQIDLHVTWQKFKKADPLYIAIAIAIIYITGLIQAGRWAIILTHLKTPLSFTHTFALSMLGIFFNQVLPSSVGGDGIRIWKLYQERHASLKLATQSTLFDRLNGVAALTCIAGISTIPLLYLFGLTHVNMVLLLLIIGSLCGFIVILYFHKIHLLQSLTSIREFSQTMHTLFTHSKLMPQTFLLSMAIHILISFATYILAQSLNVPISFLTILMIFPPIMLFSFLPISIGGWGVREGGMILALTQFGVIPEEAAAISILFGASLFLVGVLAGLSYLGARGKRHPQKNP